MKSWEKAATKVGPKAGPKGNAYQAWSRVKSLIAEDRAHFRLSQKGLCRDLTKFIHLGPTYIEKQFKSTEPPSDWPLFLRGVAKAFAGRSPAAERQTKEESYYARYFRAMSPQVSEGNIREVLRANAGDHRPTAAIPAFKRVEQDMFAESGGGPLSTRDRSQSWLWRRDGIPAAVLPGPHIDRFGLGGIIFREFAEDGNTVQLDFDESRSDLPIQLVPSILDEIRQNEKVPEDTKRFHRRPLQ